MDAQPSITQFFRPPSGSRPQTRLPHSTKNVQPGQRSKQQPQKSAHRKTPVQLHLDLGQKSFHLTKCLCCGMLYAPGDASDEQTHKAYHAAMQAVLNFSGWSKERVVLDQGPAGRLLQVQPTDPAPHIKKVGEICKYLEQAMGLDQGWILQGSSWRGEAGKQARQQRLQQQQQQTSWRGEAGKQAGQQQQQQQTSWRGEAGKQARQQQQQQQQTTQQQQHQHHMQPQPWQRQQQHQITQQQQHQQQHQHPLQPQPWQRQQRQPDQQQPDPQLQELRHPAPKSSQQHCLNVQQLQQEQQAPIQQAQQQQQQQQQQHQHSKCSGSLATFSGGHMSRKRPFDDTVTVVAGSPRSTSRKVLTQPPSTSPCSALGSPPGGSPNPTSLPPSCPLPTQILPTSHCSALENRQQIPHLQHQSQGHPHCNQHQDADHPHQGQHQQNSHRQQHTLCPHPLPQVKAPFPAAAQQQQQQQQKGCGPQSGTNSSDCGAAEESVLLWMAACKQVVGVMVVQGLKRANALAAPFSSGGTATSPSGGTAALASGGTVAMPSGGTAAKPLGGTAALQTRGTAALASGGTAPFSSGGTAAKPSGSTTALPPRGTAAVSPEGTVAVPSGSTAATPTRGTAALASGGAAPLPSGGTAAVPSGGTPGAVKMGPSQVEPGQKPARSPGVSSNAADAQQGGSDPDAQRQQQLSGGTADAQGGGCSPIAHCQLQQQQGPGVENVERVQVQMGVKLVWVHPAHRRKGIAKLMLEVARCNMVPGCYVVPKPMVAFAHPPLLDPAAWAYVKHHLADAGTPLRVYDLY